MFLLFVCNAYLGNFKTLALFSIRGRFRHMSKEYIIESTILVLRGIKFIDYRIRLNPNKQNRGKVVSAIPCLTTFSVLWGRPPGVAAVSGYSRTCIWNILLKSWCFNFRPRNVCFLTCSCFLKSTDQYSHQNCLSWPETVS